MTGNKPQRVRGKGFWHKEQHMQISGGRRENRRVGGGRGVGSICGVQCAGAAGVGGG